MIYVATALVCTIQNTFLFQKRDRFDRSRPNAITLFGGCVERGESDLHAIMREIHEELGVRVLPSEVAFLGESPALSIPKGLGLFAIRNVDRRHCVLGEGEAIIEVKRLTDILTYPNVVPDVQALARDHFKEESDVPRFVQRVFEAAHV